jgi:hypothetical protein
MRRFFDRRPRRRRPGYEVDSVGTWSAAGEKAGAVQWVTALRDKLQPFAHRVYVNQLGEKSEELVRAAYGPNYIRTSRRIRPANN